MLTESPNNNTVKFARTFSDIYLESGAENYSTTTEILANFPKANIIKIDRYQEVFNRNQQNFREQKKAQKLILATKKDSLLYDGSEYTPDYNHPHFYYNAMILNCLYDCSYCYLQGMFNSANLLVFVNAEDFITAALDKLAELKSLLVSISYDTDLLALENIAGFNAKWIETCHQYPALTVDSRTKSANYAAIKNCTPADNFILAWTLSPESIVKQHEPMTASLKGRVKSIANALNLSLIHI